MLRLADEVAFRVESLFSKRNILFDAHLEICVRLVVLWQARARSTHRRAFAKDSGEPCTPKKFCPSLT